MSDLQKIACFIHSTNISITKTEILDKLIANLQTNNIFEKLDFVFINNIGDALDEAKYTQISNKIKIVNYSRDTNLFENCTIKQIIAFSKLHPDYKVLYLHTKGVSYTKNHYFYPGIISWIDFVLYSLVSHFDNCIKLLDKYNYDTVGCNFREKEVNPRHYSGNFWWAKASYLQELPSCDFTDKYDAEFLILSKNPRYFNVYTLKHMYQNAYPLIFYKDGVDASFENEFNKTHIEHCLIGWHGLGLCNQLSSLVTCIYKCMKLTGRKIIVVHKFLTHYDSENYCPSSEIFDFEYMNNSYLKPYNIRLIDIDKLSLNINSVLYGKKGRNVINITDKFKEMFLQNNILSIPAYYGLGLNDIGGDPVPNVLKDIYIEYTLGNIDDCVFSKKFIENEQIMIDHVTHNINNMRHSKNTVFDELQENRELVDEIIVNIKFNPVLIQYSKDLMNNLNLPPDTIINVIHLRNEDDAISFWGGINKMDKDNYKEVLENKYINLIQKYIQPSNNTTTIILSMNTDNNVINFMKKNNYKYIFTEKNSVNGRELNAIIDMLLALNCNGTFIGNLNPENYYGSTFSGMLYSMFKSKTNMVRNVLIDIDHIYKDEIVC